VHALAGESGGIGGTTFNGIVLLFLAGLVVGHVVRLAREAEARLARAVELEAATRERERLARRIHDSVLQVLAMVQRRGGELGGGGGARRRRPRPPPAPGRTCARC
jgi:signal transduction histidine kinase